jgi:hypothetical protein
MFEDNESVVGSGSKVDVKLHKRHTALLFHRVREAIAAGVLEFYHIAGTINPADILRKHSGYQQVWSLLRPLMFWHGDTMELFGDESKSSNKSKGNT